MNSDRLVPPLVWIPVTVLAYVLSTFLQRRAKHPIFNPILTAAALVLLALRASGTTVDAYLQATKPLAWFVGPSVCAFAILLSQQHKHLAKHSARLLLFVALSGVFGVASGLLIAWFFSAPAKIVATLAPRSATTAVAVEIAERTNGIVPVTAAVVVVIGVLGAIIGPTILRALRVSNPVGWGASMGVVSHLVGTNRAAKEGEIQGAASTAAFVLNAIWTAIVVVVWYEVSH